MVIKRHLYIFILIFILSLNQIIIQLAQVKMKIVYRNSPSLSLSFSLNHKNIITK
jgi:hypothetical protein